MFIKVKVAYVFSMAATKTVSLQEDRFHSATPYKVDREKCVIENVKVIGEQSQNGRRYSRKALEGAASMYEGKKVNFDHPSSNPNTPRSVSDRFGKLTNVKVTQEGVFADLHYIGKHPMAEFVIEAAEKMPDAIGLSHNADGVVTTKNGESVVEQIKAVRAVDIVADPATTKSLFESHTPMKTQTLTEVIASLPADFDAKKRTFLQEMDAGGYVPSDAPIASDAAGADDPVESAFKAAMNGFTDKLYSGSISDEEFLGKMKDLVKMRSKMADMSAKKDAAASDTTPVTAGAVVTKPDPGTIRLQERLDRLEKEKVALKECKAAGIKEPSDALVEALIALPDATRKTLIEEQKKLAAYQPLPKTRSSTLTEGQLNAAPKDSKEFLSRIYG